MSNNDIKPFNRNILNSNLVRNNIDNCTTITKNLTVTDNGEVKSNTFDSFSATTLKIGPSTATSIEIGNTFINTISKGRLLTNIIDSEVTTLAIGNSLATKIEIADTLITTEIQGPLVATENITSDEIDTVTATPLLIGKTTATKVEIADTGIDTEIMGDLIFNGDIKGIGLNGIGSNDINIYGGDKQLDDLILHSTSHATKGKIRITETAQSNSITQGVFVVSGGVGIAKNIYVGGDLNIAGSSLLATNIEVTSIGDLNVNSGAALSLSDTSDFNANNITHGTSILLDTPFVNTDALIQTDTGSQLLLGDTKVTSDLEVTGNIDLVGDWPVARWYHDTDKTFATGAPVILDSWNSTADVLQSTIDGTSAWLTESSGVFTIVEAGTYEINFSGRVKAGSTNTSNHWNSITLYKGGILVAESLFPLKTTGEIHTVQIHWIGTFTASQTFDFRRNQNASQTITSNSGDTRTYFTVKKL